MRKIFALGFATAVFAFLVGCTGGEDNSTREGNVDLSPEQQSQLQPGADGDKAVTPTEPETSGVQTGE